MRNTFVKISVLIPTRDRVARLKTMLESYERTVVGYENASEIVFRVDDDDRDTQAFFSSSYRPYVRDVLVGPRMSGYDSMPVFFNELALAADGDVLMCGNDDMIFETMGWAPKILATADGFPDGVFNLGVRTHNETHFPFSIVSRKATERLGFLWDPNVFWGDIFLRDTMDAFGRCVMIPEVSVVHDWAGNAPDAVFNEADKDVVRRNPTYWTTTHLQAVHSAVERISEMMR